MRLPIERGLCTGLVLCLALACGDIAYTGQNPTAEAAEPCAGGEEAPASELSELLAELIAPRICDQVRGSFIGMPGEVSSEGAAGGRDPSVGRWWIRRCSAEVQGDQLRVAIGGNGWTWLDRESSGFRVRQYLQFDADAELSASLHIGYDSNRRIASVWLRPAPGVNATVRPRGLVRAEATGVFSALLGGVLDLTGSSASARAQAQATEEGSERLRDRLGTGFTVTFDLRSQQMDFIMGPLERGVVPERPWPQTEIPWLLNQRVGIWPGGLDVAGPIPADVGELSLDVELEEGEAAIVRRVCSEPLGRWLDASLTGGAGAMPQGEVLAEVTQRNRPQRLTVSPASCPFVLLASPAPSTTLPVLLRYRATPVESTSTEGAAGGARAGTGGSVNEAVSTLLAPERAAPSYRIQVRSVSVSELTPRGRSWDIMGGDPDPYVIIRSIPGRREIGRTETVQDNREARFEYWLQGSLRREDFPLRFVIYDEDVTTDELIGTVDLDTAMLPDSDRDLILDVRSEGTQPVQTGTLRLRVQVQTP